MPSVGRHWSLHAACVTTIWALAAGRVFSADPLEGTGELFAGLARFTEQSPPVVCLINTQDPDEIRQQMRTPEGLKKVFDLKRRLEDLSGLPCLLVHYQQLWRDTLEKPNVKAIVLTAWKKLKDEARAEELRCLVRQTTKPLIGFCGAHHFIYMAYGGKGDSMRRLRPGEVDPNPKYMPGLYKEWGFLTVRIVRRDPLFERLPDELVVPQRHYAECKQLPEDFELLASSGECRVQVIKHKTRPVYGTQFHPEMWDEAHPHGRILLENFLHIAGLR